MSKKAEYERLGGRNYAILWRKKGNKLTDKCPFCGGRHRHGTLNSHRVGHCADRYDNQGGIIQVMEGFMTEDGTCLAPKDGYILKDY